jgi:hypothetical protein
MDKAELTTYVTDRLCKAADSQDIIMQICQKTGWQWKEAEEFVKQVDNASLPEVAKRQFPLLFILALGIFLVGLGLTAYGVYSVVDSWNQVTRAFQYIIRGELPPMDAYTLYINMTLALAAPLLTGIAMMLGSLVGMRDAWYHILFRE